MTRPVAVTDRTGLGQALRALKLSGMLATLDARLAQAAAGDLGHLDFLQVLCEDEISRRASVSLARRIRRARFEEQATLEGFDFQAAPKLPAAQIRDLAALRWLHAGESVILYGPVGVGKTHVAQALGHLAIRSGAETRFLKTSRALAHLAGGHADLTWDKRLRELTRPAVLILDDFGMRELTAAQADDLYELITERAGRSLILTSNRAPAKAHMFAATCARQQLNLHGFGGDCRRRSWSHAARYELSGAGIADLRFKLLLGPSPSGSPLVIEAEQPAEREAEHAVRVSGPGDDLVDLVQDPPFSGQSAGVHAGKVSEGQLRGSGIGARDDGSAVGQRIGEDVADIAGIIGGVHPGQCPEGVAVVFAGEPVRCPQGYPFGGHHV
jgi:DNA replication protein DnaC